MTNQYSTLKRTALAILLVACLLTTTGCFFRNQIQESEVGIMMPDGASIGSILQPGMYTNMGFSAALRRLSTSAISIDWHDASILTADEQRVAFDIALTVARKSDVESVTNIWRNYNAEARSDTALKTLVVARLAPAVKTVTTGLSLEQMLGLVDGSNRDTLSERIAGLLRLKLDACGITLVYLGVTNIDPSDSYLSLREQKANAIMEGEVAQQRTASIEEKLKQEQAQTKIDLELANRANQVAEEKAKVYQDDRAYELERLRLLANVVGSSSKFYFVPQDADLAFYVTGGYGIDQIK